VIFAVLGTPSESDKSFVTDQKALEYLETFQHQPKIDLVSKYPGSSPEALDFLNRVLVFNPYYRITLENCLEHPLFSQVRNIEKEKLPASPVTLDFEKDELNRDKLRQLILYECSFYRKQ
jgi:serine/threonine protein kinase